AINMGDPNFTPPPFYDQRGPGFDRVVNGRIDIGAFEAQSTPIPTPTPTPTPTATPTPNDFSISVSPSAETVLQGGSASYTVSTAVISGNAEQISLTLGPLPPGVSGSFTTDVVTTGNASTLNIYAGTAAPGTYTITVTGSGSSYAHSATAQLIVIPAVTPTPTPTATPTPTPTPMPTPTPTPTPTPAYAAQVQQPINSDGSSVFNVKRGVVPVKFT